MSNMYYNINTVEDAILEKASFYWKEYQDSFLEEIGDIPPIKIVFKANTYAGFAYYAGSIEYNAAYFLTHMNDFELDEIIAHELAHIIQYRIYPKAKQGHGPEFRYIMQLVGFSGRTYHAMNVSNAKKLIKSKAFLAEVEI